MGTSPLGVWETDPFHHESDVWPHLGLVLLTLSLVSIIQPSHAYKKVVQPVPMICNNLFSKWYSDFSCDSEWHVVLSNPWKDPWKAPEHPANCTDITRPTSYIEHGSMRLRKLVLKANFSRGGRPSPIDFFVGKSFKRRHPVLFSTMDRVHTTQTIGFGPLHSILDHIPQLQ